MKRKINIAVFTMLICIFISVTAFALATGDVNGDGHITSADARLALRFSAGLEALQSEQALASDADYSGEVTATDARLILRVSANLDKFAEEPTTSAPITETTTKKEEPVTQTPIQPTVPETTTEQNTEITTDSTTEPESKTQEETTTRIVDPYSPSFTEISGITYKTMKFVWNNVIDAEGYELSYKTANDDDYTIVTTDKTNLILPIERDNIYTVRIRSFSSVNNEKTYTDYYTENNVCNTYFEQCLYEVAHDYNGQALNYPIAKWCCIYTCIHVFRPALEKAGYSDSDINDISPVNMVPSLYTLYYHNHPELCTVYTMRTYYNELTTSLFRRSDNADDYKPAVGDIVIMNNKKRSQMIVDGTWYPSIDHTAQIIKVYDDGTFLCTEGSITVDADKGDYRGKVTERKYFYNPDIDTYEYVNNSVVTVLDIIHINLNP